MAKKGVSEALPFDDTVLTFKVLGKIFLLTSLDNPVTANLKCDPEYALELRDQYPEDVLPGYHMNKKHWNTVSLTGRLGIRQIQELIDHSYECVVAKMKKADREKLKNM